MAKVKKNQRYILTFADGSMTDPLLPSEMSRQDHEEAISIEPFENNGRSQSSNHCDAGYMNDMRFGA